MSIWRKLMTKPVWWWETRRPYPIRGEWKYLPPIRADQGRVPFVIMTRPDTLDDALWCAWSWLRFIAHEVRLEIYIDCPVGPKELQAVNRLFPGGTITDAREFVSQAESSLPAAQGFFTVHPLGRKLGVLLELQKRETILYCDFDVFAFSPPVEILDCIKDGATGAYLQEGEKESYDGLVLATARALGIIPLPILNSGLLLIPKGSLSLDLADQLLQGWRNCDSWWMEQTALACLLKTAPMVALPRDRYLVSNTRQFYWQQDVEDYGQIVARHFTTTTRHLMYSKAMPRIQRESRQAANPRVASHA